MAKIAHALRAGDKVTIVDRFGKQRTGRAVMRGPHGWVLNMGGRHGTPAIASDENIVKVRPSKGGKRGPLGGTRIPSRGRCEITPHATVADLKECAKACGSPYFDKDTMRFFRSRVGTKVYTDGKGGALFTTSEQFVSSRGEASARRHSVRRYNAVSCSFDTVGEFQAYKTGAQANAAAKRIAASGGLNGRKRRK